MSKRSKKDVTLCRSFCTYYKPGKNEELACRGFVVVQALQQHGKVLSPERPARRALPDRSTIDRLCERVCGACEFRAGDCDFIATGGNAPACGGVEMLLHHLGCGTLTIDEID